MQPFRPTHPVRTLVAALSLLTLTAPLLAAGPAETPAVTRPSGVEVGNIDPKIRPQDDLFRHVNAGWLRSHEIPADKASWGAFSELSDSTRERVKAIIDGTVQDGTQRPGSEAQKIGDLYASFLD